MRFFLVFIVLFSSSMYAQISSLVPVFISGTDGHQTYRIPAIIKNTNGDLLAFAEGRVKGSGDFGDINIVLKISKDQGKTWGNMSTLVDYDSLQAGNPAPVLDSTDPRYPNGRIFLFYNTGNNHENEIRNGRGVREIWYKSSEDGGLHWSESTNITLQVHKPNAPQFNNQYTFKQDWRHYANTPGHAMQFVSGVYHGRIFVAANHSEGNLMPQFSEYKAHGFFTDDHGASFKLSESVNIPGSNESTATQISKDRLMMNIRNQRGDIRARIVAISSDGGTQWDTTYFDKQLPDPVCEGSILSLGVRNGHHMLAFSNAANPTTRDLLTVRISYDDGFTWVKNILIDASANTQGSKRDFTAYSDLVLLPKNNLGILYERDDYKQIVFRSVAWQ